MSNVSRSGRASSSGVPGTSGDVNARSYPNTWTVAGPAAMSPINTVRLPGPGLYTNSRIVRPAVSRTRTSTVVTVAGIWSVPSKPFCRVAARAMAPLADSGVSHSALSVSPPPSPLPPLPPPQAATVRANRKRAMGRNLPAMRAGNGTSLCETGRIHYAFFDRQGGSGRVTDDGRECRSKGRTHRNPPA